MTWKKMRRRMFDILERDLPGDLVADTVHYLLIAVVLLSVVGAVLATVPALALRDHTWFTSAEITTLIVFSIEYMLRIWVAPEHPLRRKMPAWRARLNYLFTPAAVIDFLAVTPAIVAQISPLDIHVVLVLRLLRFLKLARYSSGFNALYLSVRRERYALLACLVILITGVLLAATAMYLTERSVQPEKLGSVPDAMWWAITTLTTVGYGDTVPITPLGRIIGAITMVAGLMMLALPIAIISSSFSEVISKHNFVVTFSMVSRLQPFSDLEAPVLADLLPLFNSRSFDRGRHVVRPGERSQHMFVVLEGQFEGTDAHDVQRYVPGDVFGLTLGQDMEHMSIRAITKSKALVIEEDELQVLAMRYPYIEQRLADMAQQPRGARHARPAPHGPSGSPPAHT